MATNGFAIDLDKPLVFQVGHLREDYDKWVHIPIVSKKGPRFFANDYLEMLTKTKWWVIPIIWLPVICVLVSKSLSMGLETSYVATLLLFGLLTWTLMEYTLHRFLFHVKTTSYWANTAHYLLHGCHHKHPMDALRLVFPPAATAILCVPFWSIVRVLSTPSVAPAVFAGILSGYVMYDLTHYYLHHGKPLDGYFQSLKRYHLNHHFKLQDLGFGITSKLWDIVFGTLPPTKEA